VVEMNTFWEETVTIHAPWMTEEYLERVIRAETGGFFNEEKATILTNLAQVNWEHRSDRGTSIEVRLRFSCEERLTKATDAVGRLDKRIATTLAQAQLIQAITPPPLESLEGSDA
jgi:hypothetical protein